MTRMEELDALIAAGWGATPQNQIPEDWQQRPGPDSGTGMRFCFDHDPVQRARTLRKKVKRIKFLVPRRRNRGNQLRMCADSATLSA